MKPLDDFARKQRKYMPTFPKATGKPTVYIPGYPYEDEEPIPTTGSHGEQISITIVEIPPDTHGALFSESLNLSFRWADQHHSHVRLLRPYLPDGTPITTAIEERELHAAAKKRVEAAELRMEEAELRVEAERDLRAEAEARAVEETERRQALERELEQLRRQLENR